MHYLVICVQETRHDEWFDDEEDWEQVWGDEASLFTRLEIAKT